MCLEIKLYSFILPFESNQRITHDIQEQLPSKKNNDKIPTEGTQWINLKLDGQMSRGIIGVDKTYTNKIDINIYLNKYIHCIDFI